MPVGPISEISDPRFHGSGLADVLDACSGADERAATFLYCASHNGRYPYPPLIAPQLVSGTIDLQMSDGSIVPVREYSPLWNQATIYTYVGAPEKMRGYFDEIRLLVNAVSGGVDNTERLSIFSNAASGMVISGGLTPYTGSSEQIITSGSKLWAGGMVLSMLTTSGVPIDAVEFSGGVGPTLYNWRALPELIMAFSGVNPATISASRNSGQYVIRQMSTTSLSGLCTQGLPVGSSFVYVKQAEQTASGNFNIFAYNATDVSGDIVLDCSLHISPGPSSFFAFPAGLTLSRSTFLQVCPMWLDVYDLTAGTHYHKTFPTYNLGFSTINSWELPLVAYWAALSGSQSGVTVIPILPGHILRVSPYWVLGRNLIARYFDDGVPDMRDNMSWMAATCDWRMSLSAMSGLMPVRFAANWEGISSDDADVVVTEY